ncbi:GDSL-type esterase/lipase family protein [Cylindrospermum sp. FACHB-282]|uniref:GDSL-type esterase/lipase family protein n=1 Tax=Cylindrospermum sp. FACHB-282 TaxID=2692794 RepID=UPI001682D3E4|nr:GDSL-type esterase/lipase family protein [Cylindrospermum sp. FACHB-282]MBD2388578.1 G-D-S-L family lipolytic protein [Cylindrospermum sp. FACHB-282]
MREPYLLAAGLLTGLAIPTSALPQLTSNLPENSRSLWDLKQGSQPTVSEKIIPSVDVSLPEFSNQALSALEGSQPTVAKNIIPSGDISLPKFSNQVLLGLKNSLLNSSYPEANRTLASGSQLYYQRLASLKTGQIFTRVDDDNLQSMWESANKHQLTYGDWKSLLALEAKALAQGQGENRLSILVGDSLSMWFPREKLPAGKLWLNQGISGDTSSGVFKRLTAFSATRPDVIYLMVGINDLRNGASDEAILRNHRRIIHRLRRNHPSGQIIVQSILPTRLKTISNSRIRHLNAQIALVAKQEGANYLDIHHWFTDVEGNLSPNLTTDGLHLSPNGYHVWQSALQQIEVKLAGRQN